MLYTPICSFQIPYRKSDRAINADGIIDGLLLWFYSEPTDNRELKFPHNRNQNISPRLCSLCWLLSRRNFLSTRIMLGEKLLKQAIYCIMVISVNHYKF